MFYVTSKLDVLTNLLQYYFGDANLPKDKFLLEETKKDDGWVTLKTLLTFNRLKSLSEEAEAIITALKKSSNDLLEVMLIDISQSSECDYYLIAIIITIIIFTNFSVIMIS